MRYCENCGKEIKENEKFCTHCGTKVEDTEKQETNECFSNSETNNNDTTKDDFQKNINTTKIIVLMTGLFLIFIGIFAYFGDKLSLLKLSTPCENDTVCEITTNFNRTKNEMFITVTEPQNIIEDWQQDLYEQSKTLGTKLILPKTDYHELGTYDGYSVNVNPGQSLSINFVLSGVDLNSYVNLKKHISENAKNNKIKLILPDMLCTDNQVISKLKNAYLKQKELERIAEEKRKEQEAREKEIQDYAESVAYRFDNEYRVPFTGVNFRKCLFKVNGICFGKPFFVKGMSYEECKAEKDKLGIKYCFMSDDEWAATVKVCGGVKNLPTPDELVLLANDMYGGSFHNEEDGTAEGGGSFLPINEAKAERNNSKAYLDYFRDLRWHSYHLKSVFEEERKGKMSFFIFSNKEEKWKAFARRYEYDSTEFGTYDKDANGNRDALDPNNGIFSNVISVCVAR